MELSDTLLTLIRRWYILLLGLLMTAGLGWAVYGAVPTTYEASASILLMPSPTMVGDKGNPYLYLGGMRDALDILVRRSSSEQVRKSVLGRFDQADYSVASDPTTQSPIILVTASSASPDDSMVLMNTALATIGRNLTVMQDELGISTPNRIGMRELVVDSSATPNTKTALQAAIASVGVGLLGTLMITGYADGVLIRRRARRLLRGNEPGEADAVVAQDDLATDNHHPATEDEALPSTPDGPEAVPTLADTPGSGTGDTASLDIARHRS